MSTAIFKEAPGPLSFRQPEKSSGFDWWFGVGFEPLVLVAGNWKPRPPNNQSKLQIGGKLVVVSSASRQTTIVRNPSG